MATSLYNFGGFYAQGTEQHGHGVSEEQTTIGKIVVANGTTGTPAEIAALRMSVLNAGKNAHGLSR